VVDHYGRLDDPRIGAAIRAASFLGAEDRCLLLRLADKNDPFFASELTEVLDHHIVFALALGKEHERQSMLGNEAVQFRDEAPAHLTHQRRGCQGLAAMVAEKAHRSIGALQPRHVYVELHPVDPLDRQPDVIAEYFGHAWWYHPPGSGRSVLPLRGRLGR
jgi:hypothetical protein